MILSDKSSGSSILQKLLADTGYFKKNNPNKFHDESKFWLYALAILDNKSQPSMNYSYEFPANVNEAVFALNKLMQNSEINIIFNNNSNKETFFEAWIKLCEKNNPIFIEKSPHHLHSWQVLKLIFEFMEKNPLQDMRFVGLIRNPMDTLYSMWKRWYAIPAIAEKSWVKAYENLIKFKEIAKDKIVIIKYEDLIYSPGASINNILKLFDIQPIENNFNILYSNSISKWKKDKFFGYYPEVDVIELANLFGYNFESPKKKAIFLWPIISFLTSPMFAIHIKKNVLKRKIKKYLQLLHE